MFITKKIEIDFKHGLGLIAWAVSLCCSAQCPSHEQFWDKVISIETSDKSDDQKLKEVTQLKIQYERCGLEKDSVYARIIHRMGAFQSLEKHYEEAIQNTMNALRINTSGERGAARSYTANNYYNIGRYYQDGFSRYNEALLYYDSAIAASKDLPAFKKYLPVIRLKRGNIFYHKGDFEKDVGETTLGIQTAMEMKDTFMIISLLSERSQAYEMQHQLTRSLNDVNESLFLLQSFPDDDALANAYRYKADILADQHNCAEALDLYKTAIAFRAKGDFEHIPIDYNDAGYMLQYKCNNPAEAKKYYSLAYRLGSQANNNYACALAAGNLGQVSFYLKNYADAVRQYQQALQLLVPHYKLVDLFSNPPLRELLGLDSKSDLEIVLDNKSKSLLYLYKQTQNIQFLKSSLATALLVDSVITDLRHEQSGEQSKLYWRNDTRDFFTRTMEACYLDNNPRLAFFFMEKSRAVLLNDMLNELGASARLPASEAAKEESLQMSISIQQQKMSSLDDTSKEYFIQQNKLLQAKDDFEHYIKSLDQKYPAYYQYKYADEVPALSGLQKYLAKNNQSFVHYFMGDTVSYILAITPRSTKFTRLSQKEFKREQLVSFLQLFSDKERLNKNYTAFAAQSNSMYKTLFQKLQLPKGRVIICADNFLIPFDALCDDTGGEHFLLYDYTFSYVYSARYLLKPFGNPSAIGNFLGFAPVSFAPYLGVPDLKNAADALHASAAYYKNDKLFTGANATRSNFFNYASSYSVVSIFSHAIADTTDNEPQLFMQDSVIHLSELQRLQNPAARLVLLSACQTNIGKNATGEGVYSLARGFSSAGIPSVVATLWKADEQTIYAISEKFNEYLSKGMSKDEALQKAKLFFIENNGSEKILPYYWANMILIGNTDAINLATKQNSYWLWIGAILAVIALSSYLYVQKKRRPTKHKLT